MLLKNQQEIEGVIKNIFIKIIKLSKGKGPAYVNVKITDGKIEISSKDTLSKLGKFLIEQDEIEIVINLRNSIKGIIYKCLIDEILKETNLKCEVIYEDWNYIEDFERLILKIENIEVKL